MAGCKRHSRFKQYCVGGGGADVVTYFASATFLGNHAWDAALCNDCAGFRTALGTHRAEAALVCQAVAPLDDRHFSHLFIGHLLLRCNWRMCFPSKDATKQFAAGYLSVSLHRALAVLRQEETVIPKSWFY